MSKADAAKTYRCFFLDLYKKMRGYGVVAKTFAKDHPSYAEPIPNDFTWLGYPYLEKYLCVSDNKYIIKKGVLEKE